MKRVFPVLKQKTKFGCGIACTQAVAMFFGRDIELTEFREENRSGFSLRTFGTTMLEMREVLNRDGNFAIGIRTEMCQLTKLKCPMIAHLKLGPFQHYVVIVEVDPDKVHIMDPGLGKNLRIPNFVFSLFWTGKLLAVT